MIGRRAAVAAVAGLLIASCGSTASVYNAGPVDQAKVHAGWSVVPVSKACSDAMAADNRYETDNSVTADPALSGQLVMTAIRACTSASMYATATQAIPRTFDPHVNPLDFLAAECFHDFVSLAALPQCQEVKDRYP